MIPRRIQRRRTKGWTMPPGAIYVGRPRLSYQLTHGPLPRRSKSGKRVIVMHTCDNPSCCNPEHLEMGTDKENVADMDAKGRRLMNRKQAQG